MITLCLYANFLVVDSVYYGLSLGGDRFGVDPFAYMALGGVMETPANTLTIPLVRKLGRRASNIMCFVVSGVSLLALGVTPSGECVGVVSGELGEMGKEDFFYVIFDGLCTYSECVMR